MPIREELASAFNEGRDLFNAMIDEFARRNPDLVSRAELEGVDWRELLFGGKVLRDAPLFQTHLVERFRLTHPALVTDAISKGINWIGVIAMTEGLACDILQRMEDGHLFPILCPAAKVRPADVRQASPTAPRHEPASKDEGPATGARSDPTEDNADPYPDATTPGKGGKAKKK